MLVYQQDRTSQLGRDCNNQLDSPKTTWKLNFDMRKYPGFLDILNPTCIPTCSHMFLPRNHCRCWHLPGMPGWPMSRVALRNLCVGAVAALNTCKGDNSSNQLAIYNLIILEWYVHHWLINMMKMTKMVSSEKDEVTWNFISLTRDFCGFKQQTRG